MNNLKLFKCLSLYSCLVVLIFAFTVIFQSMTTSANAGATLYSCEIFGGSGQEGPNNLFTIDPSDGSELTSVEMSLNTGQTIRACNGLARDPTTGICWVVLNVPPEDFRDPRARVLGTIDPNTGVVTSVGTTGNLPISSIAFDSSGTLYGVVGDQMGSGNPIQPETLQTLSKINADPTFVQALGNGGSGETIGFNPNGLMYHLSGTATNKIFETINLNDMTVTNIPITINNCANDPTTALVHQSGSTFLEAQFDKLQSLTDTGVCTFVGNMDHISKGLAFDCGVTSTSVLQHFKCYNLAKKKKKTIFDTTVIVSLMDQFDAEPIATEVKNPVRFCNPVEKTGVQEPGEIIDETAHLTCYSIDAVDQEPAFEKMSIFVDNQIVQSQQLDLLEPSELCVPSDKNNEAGGFEEIQEKLDHFKCYKLERRKGKNAFPGLPVTVELEDQFDVLAETGPVRYIVEKPFRFCNPVAKNGEEVLDMEGHLTCYKIKKEEKERFESITVEADNQLKDDQMLTLSQSNTLCIPSQKRLTLTPP